MAGQDFGHTLRELRNHKGLTQEEISQELHISRPLYAHYESGERYPDAVTASRIAAYHHITVQKLLTGLYSEEIPEPDERREFVLLYDSLNPEDQENIRGYIEFLHGKTD